MGIRQAGLTELLLDDLQNLLLVKLLGKTLNSGQSLTTIALCETQSVCISAPASHSDSGVPGTRTEAHTLNPNVDVVLRLFGLAGVFVGFGEGVCEV